MNDTSGPIKRSPVVADYREARRSIDRRAVFLLGAAVVCLVFVPLTPGDLRYVGELLALWCTALAAASWLDHRFRERS